MRTIIVGGGRIGRYVAKELDDFIIVESDERKVGDLQNEFGPSHVIKGDGLDAYILFDAGMRSAEAILALTNDDSANLKIARLAKQEGVPRVIVRTDDPSRIDEMKEAGIENVICPALTASRMISATLNHEVQEVTSLHIDKGSDLLGVRIKDISTLAMTRILGVMRNNDVIKPELDQPVRLGDEIIFCSIGGMTPELRRIIAKATTDFIPFDNVLALIQDMSHLDQICDECFYLASHLNRAKVEIDIVGDVIPQKVIEKAVSWDIEVTHRPLVLDSEGKLTDLIYRDLPPRTLLGVGPGTILHRRLFKECDLNKVLKKSAAPVLICRRTIPYEWILAVYDGSENSYQAVEMALKVAIHTGSELHIINISEWEENANPLAQIKRIGKNHDIDVREFNVEGNPTLELVSRVTGGLYQLVTLSWSCNFVRKDIIKRTVNDSTISVLLVR